MADEQFIGYLDNRGLKYLLDNYIAKKTETTGALTEAKKYADDAVAALVNGAPETLDTLDELAAALKDNKDIVDVLNQSIGMKADKTALADHVNNKDNPHNITAAQLNLATVATSGNYEDLINKPNIPTVGYAANGKNYPVQLSNNQMYVNVPWEKGSSDISGTVQISQGGTGATTADAACTNLGAVKKSGDTMTGQLTATQLNASIGNSYTIMAADRNNKTTFLLQQDVATSRVQLMQIHPSQTFAERYRLPYPNAEATTDMNYDILTTKNPVTIAQGGTGATNAQDAAHSLIRGNAIAPANIEFWPASDTATHGGYLDFHFNQASDDYTSRIIESAKGELSINILGDVRVGNITYGNWKGSAIPVAYGGTGATDAATALTNLEAFGALGNAADFGSDLNNFTQIGAILVSSNIANRPSETSMYGICWNVYGKANTYIEQHYVNAATLKRYIRFKIDNVWRAWAQEYDSNFKPSAADIGAAPAVHSHANIVNGTVSFFAGISQTALLTAQQNDKYIWAIERTNATSKSLTVHYYNGSGTQEGSGVLLDSGNYTAYITPAAIGAVAASSLATVATSGNYNDLSNKPTTFAPSTHTHPISEINNIIIATSKPTTVTNGALLFVYSN